VALVILWSPGEPRRAPLWLWIRPFFGRRVGVYQAQAVPFFRRGFSVDQAQSESDKGLENPAFPPFLRRLTF
jgi:hypothetical protein